MEGYSWERGWVIAGKGGEYSWERGWGIAGKGGEYSWERGGVWGETSS